MCKGVCYVCMYVCMWWLRMFRMPVKLTTLVDFPLYGFDMSPHLAPGYRGATPSSLWSPWKRPSSCKLSLKRESNAYDLYAICNHHGQDLQSGHYTGTYRAFFVNYFSRSSNVIQCFLCCCCIALWGNFERKLKA